MVVRLAALALAAIAAAEPARTQSAGDFATLELGAGGALQTTRPYADAWTPSPSASLRAATPLHGGLAFLTFRGGFHDGREVDLPDFLALQGAAGWGPIVSLPAGIRLLPSAHVGAIAFLFDDDAAFTGALQNESELTLGLAGRVDVPIASVIRAWAGVDVVQVFTTPRDLLVFGEAGLTVAIPAPGWFRWALR